MILGDPEVALPLLEKALQLNPRSHNINFRYHGLGACNLYLGELEQAIELFRKSRAANPRIWFIHFFLAAALALRGDVEDARVALSEFHRLQPELRSLADLHRAWPGLRSPPLAALWAKTVDLGLRRAGLPDE